MKKVFKGLLLGVLAIAMVLSMFACANKVEVTFVDENGTTIATKTVESGKTLSEEDFPEAPAKEGYNFIGWYADETKLTAETLISGKITFKATYEKQVVNATIIFKNGDAKVSEKTAEVGTALTAADIPAAPTLADHHFLGWYVGETKVEAGYVLSADATATAKFAHDTAKVTFKNGDAVLDEKTLDTKTALTAADFPTEPTLADYHFIGWYVGDEKITEGYVVTADVTVTAKFAHDVATVTFKDGDDVLHTATKETGTALVAADFPTTDPTKAGHHFVGWYLGETKLEAGYVLSADVTVTAKFEKNTYRLIFVVDGETYESLDVLYGETPDVDDLPGDPEKTGFAFDGWFNGEVEFDEEAAITETVTYTAKFTKNAWVVKFVADGAEDKIFYIPMTSGKLTVENIPAKLANTDTAYFLGWYNGTTKAKADLAITEDTVFTAKFVTADDFTGTHYDITNYWLFKINGTAVSAFGKNATATFDASTGILTFTVATRPYNKYEFSFAEDGASLVVVHKYWDDIYEEDAEDDPVTLKALPAEGLTGTWQANNSDLYKVENGLITMSGSSNKNIYFGIVVADGDGYRLVVKTSSYAKAVEASVVVDEKGNWLYTETGKTAAVIYVANPTAFTDYYCKATSESVYAFTLADGSFLYVYKSGSTYQYTDFTLVDEGKKIYTFTVGEEVKTVQLTGTYFAYPGSEKGTYTGSLGEMVVDGFGNATVGGTEHTYTVAGAYFSIDTVGVLKVNFEDKTYEVAEEIGYAGTYTVYENFEENGYTLTLNGYGLATLTNAKGVATTGTYTVADGKLTLAGVGYAYNKAWTLTHDGMAMSFSNSYAKYEIVNDAYEPVAADLSDYLGKYYTDGTDTFFFSESEVSYWGDYEFAFWLDSTRDFYASAYWDGARLVIAGKDFDAGVDSAKKTDVVFLVEFADGKITMTHYCTTGLDMDDYPEQEFKTVTYTVCEKPAVTFPEWALGTWYTPEGAVVEITADSLTVNGVAAKDLDAEIVYGAVLYTMTVKNLTYTLTKDYDGNAAFGASEFYEGELPTLLKEAPADADNAFLGTWLGEDDLSLVFANNGELTFSGMSLPYVIKSGKAYFLNSDNETMMTVTLSGNTLTVTYTTEDGETTTLTLTKEGAEPEEPVVENPFVGTWKRKKTNQVIVIAADGTLTYDGTKCDYTLKDGTLSFSCGDTDFVCEMSGDVISMVCTYDYEDTNDTAEKVVEEPVVENPFVGTWKRKKTNQVIVIAADGTLTYDGTKCDYTLADGTLSFSCGDTDFVCEMSGDVISMVCTYDYEDSYDTAEKV